MALETGTYISDLVVTNPVGSTDQASMGDDHLRLIKSTIKATFANITGAVTPTQIQLNQLTTNTFGSLSASLTLAATFLNVSGAMTLNGALTTDNSSADEVGYKGLPQNSQTGGDYTFVLSDAAKHVQGTSTHTYTIPANASVAYPIGTVLTIVNGSGSGSLSIAITSDTMILAGAAGTTGTRTLAADGLASILKINSTVWLISGAGLS